MIFGWVDSLTQKDCVVCFNSSELESAMPEELYILPMDSFQQVASKPSMLKDYRRKVVGKWFSIEEFEK